MMFTCTAEYSQKTEKSCMIWSPIFNYAVDERDRRDCDGGVESSSSWKELIMNFLDKW